MKIYRRFTAWEWFGCADMVQLFVWLLLSASDRDVRRRGVALRRGQVLISQRKLAQELHMTHREMRTCISRLQMTGEITVEVTHLYTIVTICNYDVYQAPAESKRHSTDTVTTHQTTHQTTHYKSSITDCDPNAYKGSTNASDTANDTPSAPKSTHIYKNKEDISIVVDVDARTRTREEAIEKLRRDIYSSPLKIESALRATRVETQAQLFDLCEQVFADWAMTDKGSVDWAHLRNQLLIKAEAQRREAAKMASIPKPQQSVKEWRQKLAADVMKGVALNQAFNNNKKNS